MNLPTKEQLANAWPFTLGQVDKSKLGPEVMDGERPARVVEPIFDIGARVLCPPTPGAYDEDPYKAGGIGTVVRVTDMREDGQHLLMVRLDDAPARCPEQPYNPCELKRAPTV